jgi:hypothetical protein
MNDFVYLVTRYSPGMPAFAVNGVFDDLEAAISICVDENDAVAELPRNLDLTNRWEFRVMVPAVSRTWELREEKPS